MVRVEVLLEPPPRSPDRKDPVSAFLLSFAVIFVAELGDKSQLMAMTFATRYKFWTVLGAITAATAVVHLFSVALGSIVGLALPLRAINIFAALAFIGFGLWTLRGEELSEDDEARAAKSSRSAFFAVAIAFFLAELGDKTMLATVTLATTEGWFGTWVGSTIGMVAADALAIGVGAILGKHLPEKTIKYGAAILFFLFGIWLLIEGIRG
jgi:putative Ca2+/H+ antiporter (TMEM165/GDT1 family)